MSIKPNLTALKTPNEVQVLDCSNDASYLWFLRKS